MEKSQKPPTKAPKETKNKNLQHLTDQMVQEMVENLNKATKDRS